MKIIGCDCSDCTTKRRKLSDVFVWLFFALLFGLVLAGVFWR